VTLVTHPSEFPESGGRSFDSQIILPGATLGLLGGGQLGRMFALEAKRMGYRIAVLEPSLDSPCGQIADIVIQKPYNDPLALRALVACSDAITYEFENVAAEAVVFLEAQGKPIRPGSFPLGKTQDRLVEKSFIRDMGLPVTPFGPATTAEELSETLRYATLPGYLKTTRGGYDGKGQVVVTTPADAEAARQVFGGVALIYEQHVSFTAELSIVACRNAAGQQVAFPVLENQHSHSILHRTLIPGRFPVAVATRAREMALALGDGLDFIGTYCVEMFVTSTGAIMVNEIAPRPHNSGHFSLDACSISQFELQVRALCNLPLVEPELLQPAVMLNLIGDGQGDTLLGVESALALAGVHLHLYGKIKAPKGRKMGHVTVMAETLAAATERMDAVQRFLHWG
jgi:5-(carboxyamino)imidazole ribonucleotide synthase